MGRDLLTLDACVAGKEITVATVHLESLNNRRTRENQLETIFSILDGKSSTVFFMGDMNFSDVFPEQHSIVTSYQDLWRLKFPHPCVENGGIFPGISGPVDFKAESEYLMSVHATCKAYGSENQLEWLGNTMPATGYFRAWRPDRIFGRLVSDQLIDIVLVGQEDISSGRAQCPRTKVTGCTPK
jgi:hypothetical protein